MRSSVKQRREERIRELLNQEQQGRTKPSGLLLSDTETNTEPGAEVPPWNYTAEEERDPELLWKQGRGLWRNEDDRAGGEVPFHPGPQNRGSFLRSLLHRTLFSVVLFGALWGIQHYQPAWAGPVQSFVSDNLEHEMDFQAVQTWYNHNFGGAPSFIPIFGHDEQPQQLVQSNQGVSVPVEGTVAEGFSITLKGVEILPEVGSTGALEVKSMETGRVASVRNDAITGQTVTVQHSGGYTSVYGRLSKVEVTAGDWLESGESLGEFVQSETGPDTVYFAVTKDGLYVDPAEVVPLD